MMRARFIGLFCMAMLPAMGEVRVFQEGLEGWSGTFDQIVAGDGSAVSGETAPILTLDGDPVTSSVLEDRNLLLRFDGIFGDGPDQVPLDAGIVSARLILTTGSNPSTGPYVIGRLVDGVTVETRYEDLGLEGLPGARGTVDLPLTAGYVDQKAGEVVRAEVTEILRSWQSGDPNHGFALYSSYTTDSWGVSSSSHPIIGRRPRLEVEFEAQTTVRTFPASRSAVLFGSPEEPTRDGALQLGATLDRDPSGDQEVLMAFDGLFGEADGQIGEGERILAARLVFTTVLQVQFENPSSDSLDVFGVFPMTVDWDLEDGDDDGFPDLDFGLDGPTQAGGEIGSLQGEFSGVGEDSRARADVTDLIRSWRAGADNFGFNVKMVSDGSDGWLINMPGNSEPFVPILEVVTTSLPPTSNEGTLELREGAEGYAGTFQMRVDPGDGRRMGADFQRYVLEGDPPEEDATDLIRFGGLIGDGERQVPTGATVIGAWLEYSTAGASISSASEGPFAVAPLSTAVGMETLYSELDGGEGLEGVRGSIGARVGGYSLTVPGVRVGAEVTPIVQAWVDGAANHGFGVFASQSSDGWEVSTIGDVVARRPALRVEYVTEPTNSLTYPVELVSILNADDQTEDGTVAGLAKVDGDPETRILFGFDNLIGDGEGQLAPEVNVLKAWLVCHTGPLEGDSCIGPVVVEPMSVDWDLTTVFSDFGGDGPDQADGETAGAVAEFLGMGLATECRVDITELVKAWQGGADNEGLMLRADTDDSWWLRMPGGGLERAPSLVVITAAETGGSGFDDYVASRGFPGLSRGDDRDGDGLPALVEYGLGLNPGAFDEVGQLVQTESSFELIFIKGNEAKNDSAIRYEIEWSDNLTNWTEAVGVVETEDDIGLQFRPTGRGFFRLEVTEN